MESSPQVIRKNGSATLVIPNNRNGNQPAQSRGQALRCKRTAPPANNTPNSTRKATSVKGPISSSASLIHKKEADQMAPRKINAVQCLGCMGLLTSCRNQVANRASLSHL